MKKILRSTFGTLVVTAFLAIAPPMAARGGHGGHHGGTAMDMLAKDMPKLVMLRLDALTILHVARAVMHDLQVAHVIGMAAATGEAITGIRPMGIPGSAITAW